MEITQLWDPNENMKVLDKKVVLMWQNKST